MATATEERTGLRRTTMIGVALAFGAAVSYGSSQVLTRQGVSDLAPPLVGSFIALFWGTLGFLVISLRSLRNVRGDLRMGSLYFGAAGVFSAAGVMLMFQALSRGEVVIISPVLATNPLFTLILAAVFLRGVERITPPIVIGALLVVAGVVVLSAA
ncbi:MAG: EamA family transporter [Dehalococcoidia bacterium]